MYLHLIGAAAVKRGCVNMRKKGITFYGGKNAAFYVGKQGILGARRLSVFALPGVNFVKKL